MFDVVNIFNYKGLKENKLLECLGKINVLCGKNNSGKSTILEAIMNPKNRIWGKYFTEDEFYLFYEIAKSTMRHFFNNFYEKFKEIFNSNKHMIFFEKDFEKFKEIFDEIYKSVNSNKYVFHPNNFENNFKQIFSNTQKSILVSPKRNLEYFDSINPIKPISPNGSGILNYLFYAKNQITTSDHIKTYNKIKEAFINISGGYDFDIFMDDKKNNNLILKFSLNNKNWLNATDSGLGLQDLLVILFFAINPQYMIVLIEEPGNHLHPDIQRKLIDYLKNDTVKQYILSTHSNIFLNNLYSDKIFWLNYYNDCIKINDVTSKAIILNDLGYSISDNLISDLIILIEGPTDKPVIEEFLLKLGLLKKYNIKIWALGGDIMDQQDLSVFLNSNNVIALIDNDPKSKKIREKFKIKCEEHNIHLHKLERYSIENYFSLSALKIIFKNQIPDDFVKIDYNTKLFDQIGINVKNNNRKIVQNMSIDDIKNTDLYTFFDTVEEKCKEK